MRKDRVFIVAIVVVLIGAFAWFASRKTAEEAPATETVNAEELIRAHTYVKGPSEAKVTIVEFLDPECEACRAMHPIVQQVFSEFPGQIRLAYRYMPFHGNSMYVASVLEEARDQGRFEQALDILFEKQPEWGSHHDPRPDLVPGYLAPLGIKADSLDRAQVIGKHGSKIEIDHSDGMKAGVVATPTFFVNGVKLADMGYEPLKAAVEQALAEKK